MLRMVGFYDGYEAGFIRVTPAFPRPWKKAFFFSPWESFFDFCVGFMQTIVKEQYSTYTFHLEI